MEEESSFGLIFIFLVVSAVISSCFNQSWNTNNKKSYDRGYENAWEDEDKEPSCWASQEEKDGYEEGLADSWMYDDGLDDAYRGKKPEYTDDPDYMDGYKSW